MCAVLKRLAMPSVFHIPLPSVWTCRENGPNAITKIMINWKPEGRKNEAVTEECGMMGYIQI